MNTNHQKKNLRSRRDGNIIKKKKASNGGIKMNITYRQEGDYLIPNLDLPEQPEGEVGRFGMMRDTFLYENKHVTYSIMSIRGTLKQHLMEVDQQAEEMMYRLQKDLLQKNPAPDKTKEPAKYLAHLEKIRQEAESIVLREIVYI